jgi:hypothetical protein
MIEIIMSIDPTILRKLFYFDYKFIQNYSEQGKALLDGLILSSYLNYINYHFKLNYQNLLVFLCYLIILNLYFHQDQFYRIFLHFEFHSTNFIIIMFKIISLLKNHQF